jgi:HK97 family phage major capsid protein
VLYPFLETKAAYIPGNLNLAGPNLRVISPTEPAIRFPLLDLLRTVPWNELVVPYLPLVFTNNAAQVEYAAAKPESTNTGDIATMMMKTVATWKEVPRQILRYIPALRSAIESELRTGVLAKMQDLVLNSPGTTTTMKGILSQVSNTAAGATLIAQIFDAIGKIEAAGGTVDAILMNPTDYAAMLLAEYTTNQYNVLVQGERFGQYRIIRTGVVAADSAVVGDFSTAVTLFVGEAANVQATEALGFKTNVVTIRAEMDATVLVERPWLIYKCNGVA